MKKLWVFLLVSGTVSIFAQNIRITNGNINMLTTSDRFQFVNAYDGRFKSLEGERYFYDSLYRPGELKTSMGLYTTELSYRFDQIERTVQVKLENGKEMFLFEKDVEYFKLFVEDQEVLFMPATVPNGRKLTMLQVIYKSPTMQLYRDARKYIFRVKSESLDGYSSDRVYDEIRKDYRYYFRQGNEGAFKEVKVNTKSFINILPEKRSRIIQLFRAGESKGGLTVSKLAQIIAELDKEADLK